MTAPIHTHHMHLHLFTDGERTEYHDALLDINVERSDDQIVVVMTPRVAWYLVQRLLGQLEVGDEQVAAHFIGKLRASDYTSLSPLIHQCNTTIRDKDRKPKTQSKRTKAKSSD